MKVAAKTKTHQTPFEVEYDFGDENGKGLKGLTEKFGEEVVASRAKQSLVIDLQALIRRHLDKGKDFDAGKLKEAVKGWKPSTVSVSRKPKVERLKDDLASLSPEQRAELLKALQAQQHAGGQAKAHAKA